MMELNPNPSNDTGAAAFVFKCQYGLNTILMIILMELLVLWCIVDFNTDY